MTAIRALVNILIFVSVCWIAGTAISLIINGVDASVSASQITVN